MQTRRAQAAALRASSAELVELGACSRPAIDPDVPVLIPNSLSAALGRTSLLVKLKRRPVMPPRLRSGSARASASFLLEAWQISTLRSPPPTGSVPRLRSAPPSWLHSSPIPSPGRSIVRVLSSLSRLTATSSVPYTLRVWRGAAPYHTSCAVASPIIPRTGPAPLLLLLVPCAVQRSASGSAAGRLPPRPLGIYHLSLFLISFVLRPVRSRHARARLIRLIRSIRRLLVWKVEDDDDNAS